MARLEAVPFHGGACVTCRASINTLAPSRNVDAPDPHGHGASVRLAADVHFGKIAVQTCRLSHSFLELSNDNQLARPIHLPRPHSRRWHNRGSVRLLAARERRERNAASAAVCGQFLRSDILCNIRNLGTQADLSFRSGRFPFSRNALRVPGPVDFPTLRIRRDARSHPHAFGSAAYRRVGTRHAICQRRLLVPSLQDNRVQNGGLGAQFHEPSHSGRCGLWKPSELCPDESGSGGIGGAGAGLSV